MRIIKTSSTQITPEVGQIVNNYQESGVNTYSCNYVNGIIESGSNENGSWIKYADGTMICTKKVMGQININKGWGSMYVSDNINIGTTPQTFTSFDTILYSIQSQDAGQFWYIGSDSNNPIDKGTNNNFGSIALVRPTSRNNTLYIIYAYMKGKWK